MTTIKRTSKSKLTENGMTKEQELAILEALNEKTGEICKTDKEHAAFFAKIKQP